MHKGYQVYCNITKTDVTIKKCNLITLTPNLSRKTVYGYTTYRDIHHPQVILEGVC